jgi:hypothetical protein
MDDVRTELIFEFECWLMCETCNQSVIRRNQHVFLSVLKSATRGAIVESYILLIFFFSPPLRIYNIKKKTSNNYEVQ